MKNKFFLDQYNESSIFDSLQNSIAQNYNITLKGLVGSSLAFYFSKLIKGFSFQNFIIFKTKEESLYFLNDIESLLQKDKIFFFPESKKDFYSNIKSNSYDLLQRTELLDFLNSKKEQSYIVVTYTKAICENLIDKNEFKKRSIELNINQSISFEGLNEKLFDLDFRREDFVMEPGEFAVRGGIIDIFPFSSQAPYRIEFFGDEISRIRSFDIESQRSDKSYESIKIVSNILINLDKENISNIFQMIEKNCLIFLEDIEIISDELSAFLDSQKLYFSKTQKKENYVKPEIQFINANLFSKAINNFKVIEFDTKKSDPDFRFNILPQPSFNRNFDLFTQEIKKRIKDGFRVNLCCTNIQQQKRLKQILTDLNSDFIIDPLILPVSKGFVDNDEKIVFYTDHQIFERYHKFKFRRRYKNHLSIALKQINNLKKGDYITHIDHGIGKYIGLEKIDVDGNIQESIKLIYGDRDILYLSIHSLHKISKYSGKDGKTPKIYKLGSKAWALLKQKTKKNVKKIAYDLIKVYAERKQKKGFKYDEDSYLQNELEASFIYEDTEDQNRVTLDIKKDMQSDQPMDRLICGDVGFGKTELAIRAAFKAVDNNKQVAVLVPTTILAFQHFKTFSSRLKEFPVSVNYLNRFKTNKEKAEIINNINSGKIDILIGTHQLVNNKISFKDLGLLIIDEEQKFGVNVKDKLKSLRKNIDVLTLSATPIPRTLQFSLMSARDLSLITTPPPNRYPIKTSVIRFDKEILTKAIRYEIERGGQVFFVNNKIQNIEEIASLLKGLVPESKIAVAHGRLTGKKLESLMIRFINNEFDILVSTTIIESGLDVPNANTIFINNANNFGLSDLHQMRGRVGRSNKKAFCYLITPEFNKMSDESKKRIAALEYYSDLGSGFNIAMKDLEIRGAGDLLGGEQSGFINEMGFETYQKILDEAINELRNTEFNDIEFNIDNIKSAAKVIFETDLNLMFPNYYINSNSERLDLYTRLSKILNQSDLTNFENELIDRFGKIPVESINLLKSIKLRWLADSMNIDKIIMKKGYMICHIKNIMSSHDSNNVQMFLKYSRINKNISFKEKKVENVSKLILRIPNIKNIENALEVLKSIKSN